MQTYRGHVRHSIVTLFTTLILVFALAACGNTTADAPTSQDTSPTEADVASEPTPAEEDHGADEEHGDEGDHGDEEHGDEGDHGDEEHGDEGDHAHGDEDHDHGDEHDAAEASIDELVAALTPIAEGETLNVVATTNIVGDVVSQVGGDAINLTTLMPVGADPHTFEPTPQEIATVSEADVVFMNGLALEETLEPLIENSGIAAERIIPVSTGVETIEFAGGDDHDHDHEGEDHDHEGEEETQGSLLDLFADTALADEHDHDHSHSGADPHTWMSPVNVMVWTDNVAAVFSTLDPANAEVYATNAATYTAELEELDAFIQEQIAQIPEADRELVTDHTAFGYYANEYGLEQVGAVIPAYSTLAEPSAQEVAALQEAIAQYNVPAIFVGTTVNPSLAEQVAADTDIQLLPVYTGSLSEAGGPADSYIAMMRYNTEQFVSGLASE